MTNRDHSNRDQTKAPDAGDSNSGYWSQWAELWNRFWFTPRDPALLGLLRVLVGGMIFYTHLVYTLELTTFFGGDQALLPTSYRSTHSFGMFQWSHLDWISDGVLWPAHILALIVFALFTLGVRTRVTGVLSSLLVISYAHRATGIQFGLDQINSFMTMYLALGPSGQFLSFDRWWQNRGQGRVVEKTVLANVSIRLMQTHLCIVYLFAGLGKLAGDTWWNGDAIWGAFANHEYQTLDMTWLADHLWLLNLITYTALVWEVCYPFLVWPKLTRPIFVGIAVIVHLGIGFSMGMITFGLIMVFANLSFLSTEWTRKQGSRFLPDSLL